MINSLFKDSHIARSNRCCTSNPPWQEKNNNQGISVTSKGNQGIIVRKPAEISFSGFSSSMLANQKIFKALIGDTRIFLGERKNNKDVKDTISAAVWVLQGKSTNTNTNVAEFLALHKKQLKKVMDSAENLLKEEHKKEPLTTDEMFKAVGKTINTAIHVFPTVENPSKIYTNKTINKFLIMANDSQAVFGALFALILTGIFRPAAIMATPGDKKNKDDKKYAAAQSVSSGIIGYVVSLLISSPLAKAMKKIEDEPEKYLKGPALEYLTHTKALEASKKMVNLLHEAILAPPRAIITIALIPPILKYVFGWEKKKKAAAKIKDMPQPTEQKNEKSSQVSFTGGTKSNLFKPFSNLHDKLIVGLTKCLTKIFEKKSVAKFIEKYKNSDLVSNLTILISIVLSGFYIQQTLKNDKLDEQKRKTLAINQAVVWLISTLSALSLNKYANKVIDRFADRYSAVNAHDPDAIKLFHGIYCAKTIVIFGMMYRFIAPVFATPIANYFGNRLQQKEEAEKAKLQQDKK